ncbi:C50 family peptidase [Aspergillus clavatus NRRL 1]|uniref:separase n=1 Tax=Aspergillus clavatus (strain ATCC 1007 / CBS 513.65 / DSM 816 / NCTC 3887 / NRRL 1 / QM 1276 / 107) TaxID=344612 RepID=A1CAU0_ASPCL|nr:separin, putative [Aspergillus clavatus NRRL 1]EAW12858.1 separin, putative [Aspergillus clavatus NRRL 1]
MAVATLLPEPSMDSVKQAVRSISTCCNATVLSLQTLVCGPSNSSSEVESNVSKKTVRSRKTPSTTSSRAKTTTRAKVSSKGATTTITIEHDAAHLSSQEKVALATEVFNTTLKTLGDASKLPELRVLATSTPLRPVSPNRLLKSPTKSKPSQRAQSNTTGTDGGVLAVAECASIALSCLRSVKAEQGGQENEPPNIQLEQGACVLVGRYLSLGLNDLAYRELRGLKRRIQQYLDSQDATSKKATGQDNQRGADEETIKERMSDLLSLRNLSHGRPLHGLIVSFQTNALRLIAMEKRPSTVQKVLASLQLTNSSSPAKVITAAVESQSITKDKAALQLQLLSNTIMSMSSGGQQPADDGASRERLKPITTLLLQLLSLEVRCMSWKLSGHVCDDVKEMWDPLARYLANFVSNFKGIEKAEFAAIYKTIVRIQAAVATIQKQAAARLRNNLSVARIATVLGQLAQEAGCFEEASTLLTEALNPLADEGLLSSATVRCKIAALHLLVSKKSTKLRQSHISHLLAEATAALGTPLRGNQNDLDELLVEAAKMKKVAMSWLGEKVAKDYIATDEDRDILLQIYTYLNGFVKFLRRYLGRKPTPEDEEKDYHLFHKRLDACKSIVLAAVDSAVAIGKLSVMSDSPSWDSVLPTLVDCQRLLVTVECSPQATKDSETSDSGAAFIRMSNLFWSRYLKDKDSGKGPRELLHVLKHSVSFLPKCSLSQRKTGFATLKYERLAHSYLEANMVVESGEAFRDSIREYIDTGLLKQLLADIAGGFPSQASQDPKSSGFTFSRVLSAYLRVSLRNRNSASPKFFDSPDMDLLQRGFLLEWQLGILTELPSHTHSDERFRSAFDELMFTIFDIYTINLHPIRRMRSILFCLRFASEHPGSLGLATVRTVVEEGLASLEHFKGMGEDLDLNTYATHMQNSVCLTLGLHEGDLRPDALERILSSWNSMMHNCSDRKSLVSCIGDVDHLLVQMKAIVDYTEIYGLWKLQLTALELVLRITELHETGDVSEAIILLSRLVLQYCRLGHCKKAEALLARADQYLKQKEVSCLASLSHKLARAEYLLETGELEQAASVLSISRAMYERNQKKQDLSSCSIMSKIAWERMVADAMFISSRLSFAQGSVPTALFFAKLCVKLNCRIWAKVERLSQRKQEKAVTASSASDLEGVVEGVARLDVSQSVSLENPTVSFSQGAPFWPHVGSHHTALLNLAYLSAHYGLFQDAVYYGEQALKINKTLNANVRLIASQAQLASYWIFGGRITEGQELLSAAESLAKKLESSVELISLQMSIASLHRMQGNHDDEWQALLRAEQIMGDVAASEAPNALPAQPRITELETGMDKLRIRGISRKTQPTTTTTRRTRATTVSSKSTTKTASDTSDANTTLSQSLLRLKSEILQQQAACSRALREFEKASSLLTDARKFAVSRDSQISLHLEESEHHLADAIRQFAMHAVYCVLPESTISLPALQSPKKVASESATTSSSSSSSSSKQSTTRKARTPAKGTRSRSVKAGDDFTMVLSKAGQCLNNIFSAATTLGSTLDSHTASRLMSRISMLSHTTAPGCLMPWSQPPANVNEIGRIGAFTRERIAIGIDKQLSAFNDPLLWPAGHSSADLEADLCSTFVEEYIDILPENFNVLSLSLSTDCTEFIISRLRKNHSPFLLRLPLKRGNSEDEEDQFTFEDGRGEMQDLIKLANESAHAAKLQKDRQSKKDWWKTREALDQRLENLLQNIENVWFGGFRGIFSPTPHADAALTLFANAFHNILDKHLPSRRKGGRGAAPKLSLHQNVLELFVGVKDLEDQEDPEETLMDLLYFVVDILQFQGERNAYDEIDFDMMVVETLDAIRGYHEAAERAREAQQAQHTVLVLDKALHLFPWESLPCLQRLPVCRVPSLECLRDRIVQFQSMKADTGESGFGIDRGSGTYVLNPTGDLQTTQATFEADLGRLTTWTGISKREPTEEEFRGGLESKSMFLYFGHGSGAQYIRGRTIKRLDRCAVTFLMGCSSGTLTEAGEYEPYGTPMNYLQAGCPALVATLWDVTDKDIDRFAKSTFEKWGLLGEQGANDRQLPLPSKGRSRTAKSSGCGSEPPQPVTLDEAVSKSRGACVLKYLNGAAPVIYGVPSLFLE